MSKSQRTKGASYEREVSQYFSEQFGKDFKRNIGQARDGGNDIDIGPLVTECKRRKSLKTLMGWYAQATKAAQRRANEPIPPVPVVVMREDSSQSMVLLSLDDFTRVARYWLDESLLG